MYDFFAFAFRIQTIIGVTPTFVSEPHSPEETIRKITSVLPAWPNARIHLSGRTVTVEPKNGTRWVATFLFNERLVAQGVHDFLHRINNKYSE